MAVAYKREPENQTCTVSGTGDKSVARYVAGDLAYQLIRFQKTMVSLLIHALEASNLTFWRGGWRHHQVGPEAGPGWRHSGVINA